MKIVRFYSNSNEIVKEQNQALKGVCSHKILVSEPVQGSLANLIMLKLQLLEQELNNANVSAKIRASKSYYEARQEAMRLNKAKYNGKVVCEYCKNTCNDNRLSVFWHTVDHVVPLSEGGNGTDQSNLKIACRFCNRFKGSLDEESFLKMIDKGIVKEALALFSRYLDSENLQPTHEVLSYFVKNRKKIKDKLK